MNNVKKKTRTILKFLSPSFNAPQYIGNIIAIFLSITITIVTLSILPSDLGNLNIEPLTNIAKQIVPILFILLVLFFVCISIANEQIDEDGTLNQFNHDLYPEMQLKNKTKWKKIYPMDDAPYDALYVTKEIDEKHLHHLHLKGYREPILITTDDSRFLIMEKDGVKTITTLLNPQIIIEQDAETRESILHYKQCTTKTLKSVEIAEVLVTIKSGLHKHEFVSTTGKLTYYETLNTSEYLQHKRKEAKTLKENKIKNQLETLLNH